MSRVLILDTGTQGYITISSLKKAGHFVCLLYKSKHNYADDSKYVDVKIQTDAPYDNEYLETVKRIIQEQKIDAVIPMSDFSSQFLSRNIYVLNPIVKYVLPEIDVFERGYDKNSLMTLCSKNGYPHPQTINDVTNLDGLDIENLKYPLLIKPNHTCGGRGMTLVKNSAELKAKFEGVYQQYGDCHLQEYIPQGGAQVEVQLYINQKQELVDSSVIYKYRWYPENGGSSCCATSIINEKVVGICYSLLKDIGWVGFADFDTIEDPRTGELLVMELNPRVPACVKAVVASGIDWPNIILNEYLGYPQKKAVFKQGVLLKHLGFETLWFFYSKNRFKTKPSLLKVFGKGICYQDLDLSDPMPFIKGTWHNFKKQLSPSFRKSKGGTR
ncbi:ATP-grasp domain-containing protein [Bacteroides heparinolyticus]|uniref:carboxylate--amine ligase n=1 Tax=Prevotella heparinolytica TaxID=28113 RepID=UPI0023F06092|nr:ATP-grasp domain-containing protein [Bacteroides heparinolyticus]